MCEALLLGGHVHRSWAAQGRPHFVWGCLLAPLDELHPFSLVVGGWVTQRARAHNFTEVSPKSLIFIHDSLYAQ